MGTRRTGAGRMGVGKESSHLGYYGFLQKPKIELIGGVDSDGVVLVRILLRLGLCFG